jgi:hypothetical protein
MLIEECWKNNVLLLGISKDTAVHEFKNHVMPICINNNIWPNCRLTQDNINNIPNTDRMFLQSMSMLNHNKISVPWALIEYDSDTENDNAKFDILTRPYDQLFKNYRKI